MVHKDLTQEVVDLMLVGARRDPSYFDFVRLSVAVQEIDFHLRSSLHATTKIRHADAAFKVFEGLCRQGCDHGIDENGERDVGLVGVARVVLDLDGADLERAIDLSRRKAGPIGVPHRFDEVIDERLNLGGRELFCRECSGRLSEHRVANLRNFQ